VLFRSLAGAALSSDNESMFGAETVSGVGHYIFVLDITKFMPLPSFIAIVEKWFDRIKTSKTRPGVDEIFIPGEPENKMNEKASEIMQVMDKTMDEIKAYADETGYKGKVL
jgi:LDH2 family malate/lactate/ureidoglycolate dehydrogenase